MRKEEEGEVRDQKDAGEIRILERKENIKDRQGTMPKKRRTLEGEGKSKRRRTEV